MNAVLDAGGLPIAIPHAFVEPELLNVLLPKLDGIFLLGSPSNVQSHLYGENGDESDADPGHDLPSMALVTAGLERRTPVSVTYQGLQELAVVTGGILYRRLCDHPQFLEYREDMELPVEQQYAPFHEVQVQQEELLFQLISGCSTFWVNPLCGQGAKTPGPQLRMEARLQDGLVGTASVRDHPFMLSTQRHPEWNSSEYTLLRLLLESFTIACQNYLTEKQQL